MTNYRSLPIEPFAVPARVLRTSNGNDPPAPPANGHTATDDGGPRLPEELNSWLADFAVGCVLFLIYMICRTDALVSAGACVILLAVMLWRLSVRGRAIAGPILAIATVMLVAGIARYCAEPPARALITAGPEDLCMPVVLAAALYYTRVKCHTADILMFLSAALLASGLLPGLGWLACFLAARYLIWLAVVLGLFLDYITSPRRASAPVAAPTA